MEQLLLLCPWDRGSQARPRSGGLEGCGQQGASREEGPNKMEVVHEALVVRSSGELPGGPPATGPAARAPPRSSLSAHTPTPVWPQGQQTWPVAPLRASLADKYPAGRPCVWPEEPEPLSLQVCLELPCPPLVSLDSPALSRLISGSCCCRQRKLASERKRT